MSDEDSGKSFEVWRKVLATVMGFEVLFGLMVAFFGPRVVPFYSQRMSQALWQQDSLPDNVVMFHDWIFGVLGATIAGSALVRWLIIRQPFKRKELWAWWALLLSLLIWAVPDTGLSAYHGVYVNVIFNLFPIVGGLVPLLATKKYFA